METITIKMEESLLKEIDSILIPNRYSTRTEFIRDAIRQRLSDLEKQELIKKVVKLRGSSKRKTSDEDLHKVRKQLFKE